MPYSAGSPSHVVTACIVRTSGMRGDALISLLPSSALILVKAILGDTAGDLRTLAIMQPDVVVLDSRESDPDAALQTLARVLAALPRSRFICVGAHESPEFDSLAVRCNVRRYRDDGLTLAGLRRAVLGAAADLDCRKDVAR
jgi:hypothetical protein